MDTVHNWYWVQFEYIYNGGFMSNRISCHSSKIGSKGVYNVSHNDRNAKRDVEYDSHIDGERSCHNRYINYAGKGSFLEGEQEFYKANFEQFCMGRNERYKKHGVKRFGTTEDYRKSSRSCPTETILQIGNRQMISDLSYCLDADEVNEFMRRLLIKAFKLFMKALRQYRNNLTVLNCALHMDEPNGTPHLHIRSVLHYYDEQVGAEKVSANRALEKMGFECPNVQRPESRYNNRQMSFSSYQRRLWIECLANTLEEMKQKYPQYAKAIDVVSDFELEPMKNQKALEKNDYIIKKQEEELARRKRELEYLEEFEQYVDECEREALREEMQRNR